MLKKLLFSRTVLWILSAVTIFFALIFSFVRYVSPHRTPGCAPISVRNAINPSETAAVWQNTNIIPLLGLGINTSVEKQKVLGIQSQDKEIEISISQKELIARQGSDIIVKTPVNVGKYVNTPTGDFSIFQKHFAIDISGGSNFTKSYYYLPNVPFALYFKSDYAIVGSYWSKSFGGQSGFGCIEVPIEIAEILYYWADSPTSSSAPGTKVIIKL